VCVCVCVCVCECARTAHATAFFHSAFYAHSLLHYYLVHYSYLCALYYISSALNSLSSCPPSLNPNNTLTQLPELPYLTMLDWYVLWGLTVLCLLALECIVVEHRVLSENKEWYDSWAG
jgi:hypothetical protein